MKEVEILRKSTWLKKIPKNVKDLWSIMEEAKKIYELKCIGTKNHNEEYANNMLKNGFFVGTIVYTNSAGELKDIPLEITAIRGNIVHIKTNEGKGYKLRNFEFYKKEDEKNDTNVRELQGSN